MTTNTGKVEPGDLAGISEHSQQMALMCACSMYQVEQPELRWIFAIPNGGDRNLAVASNLKAEGVKSGVSDCFLPAARRGFHGLFIEMKKPSGGAETPNQKLFAAHVQAQGYCYGCFHTWHAAFRAIMWYLGFTHTQDWQLPE